MQQQTSCCGLKRDPKLSGLKHNFLPLKSFLRSGMKIIEYRQLFIQSTYMTRGATCILLYDQLSPQHFGNLLDNTQWRQQEGAIGEHNVL